MYVRGICMVEAETNAPDIEKLARAQATYSSVLLAAINEARRAFVYGDNWSAAVDGLISILTPDILEALTPEFNRLDAWLEAQISEINAVGDDFVEGSVVGGRPEHDNVERGTLTLRAWRAYKTRQLSLVIEALDNHGLLRDIRREEVGGRE